MVCRTLVTAGAFDGNTAAAAMTKVGSTATFSPQPISFAEPAKLSANPADVLGCVPTAKGGGGCTRVLPLPRHPLVAAPKMSRVAAAAETKLKLAPSEKYIRCRGEPPLHINKFPAASSVPPIAHHAAKVDA